MSVADLEEKWRKVQVRVFRQFRKNPDLNAILFLIGIRELGVIKKKWKKEEKQDLMHIAICTLLSKDGFYTFDGYDEEGWPHWSRNRPLPQMTLEEQENFMKKYIIDYFETI